MLPECTLTEEEAKRERRNCEKLKVSVSQEEDNKGARGMPRRQGPKKGAVHSESLGESCADEEPGVPEWGNPLSGRLSILC